eukprot:2979998-Prorocentrum_lima.AAC.1
MGVAGGADGCGRDGDRRCGVGGPWGTRSTENPGRRDPGACRNCGEVWRGSVVHVDRVGGADIGERESAYTCTCVLAADGETAV